METQGATVTPSVPAEPTGVIKLRTPEVLAEEAKKFMAEMADFDLSAMFEEFVPEWAKSPLVNIKVENSDMRNSIGFRPPWNLYFVNKDWYNSEKNKEKITELFKFCLVVNIYNPYRLRFRDEIDSTRFEQACRHMYQVIPIKCIRDRTPNTAMDWAKRYSVIPTGFNFSAALGFTHTNIKIRNMIMFGKCADNVLRTHLSSHNTQYVDFFKGQRHNKYLESIISVRHKVNEILAEQAGELVAEQAARGLL